jgi:hypothetical protein
MALKLFTTINLEKYATFGKAIFFHATLNTKILAARILGMDFDAMTIDNELLE